MNSDEWPLIVFTLAIQFSVGVALMYDLFLLYPVFRRKAKLPHRFRIILLVSSIAAGVGVLFWILPLGHPVNAAQTLSNLNHSWLSREILFVIIYSVMLLAVTFLQFRFPQKVRSYKRLLDGASIAGLILIYVMSRVYYIPSVPAWNSIFTPVDFFLAVLLSGSAFTLLFQLASGSLASQKALAILFITVAVIQLVLLPVHMTWLGSGNEPVRQQCVSLLLDQYLPVFYLRLGFEILTIAFGFWAFLSIRSDTLKRRNLFIPTLLAFLCVIGGLVTDRFLFYIQHIPML